MIRPLLVAILIAVILAAIGVGSAALSQRRLAPIEDPYAPITCVPDKETAEKIREILYAATEEALKNHVVRMHEIWMKDDTDQPRRATNGTRQGVKAFIGGREFLKKWNPPIC